MAQDLLLRQFTFCDLPHRKRMAAQIDVAKLVGAASAPVALIIATSIFLSNLGAKYAMLGGNFREVSNEYRKAEDKGGLRAHSLQQQISLYSRRLRLLMKATFWLAISILCFIATVLFTSISVLMPSLSFWPWVTAVFSIVGMLILAGSVGLEMAENHCAKEGLVLETAEFPDVLPSGLEAQKSQYRSTAEHEQKRAA
jgi:hypothetical protein